MAQSYLINGKTITFTPKKFSGNLSIDEYETQIYKALGKLGITKEYILISTNEVGTTKAVWKINSQVFSFSCSSQESLQANMGALAQALQEDVRQITRGIKDMSVLMKQYVEEDLPLDSKKKSLLNFSQDSQGDKEKPSLEENSKQAKDTSSTTQLFPNSENELLYVDETQNIDPKYAYLESYAPQKLEVLYLKLKEQCAEQNLPKHPMFTALKLIRKKRGLKL